MSTLISRRYAVMAALTGLLLGADARLVAQGAPTLPHVTLSDQFDRRYDLTREAEHALIVLVSDRRGFDAGVQWARALRAAFRGDTGVLLVADLKGAPRLVHGMIRRGLPHDTTARVLLDWDGEVAPALRGRNDDLVAVMFGRGGLLHRRVVLPIDRVDSAVVATLRSP